MPLVRVVIKPTAGGAKLEKQVDTASSVRELKEALAGDANIPADDQRLIYKGQILRDERTVESYGIDNDHVLHLVRGKPTGNTQSSTAGGASASTSGVPTPGGAPAAAGGAGGPLAGLMDPNMLQQLMQSSFMQQLLANPEMMRSMLQLNPGVRELMDRDPQMAQMLNNPELLRDTLNVMSNPSLMREFMRNNDRALSNMEALPGGFNALRQLYENVQEPLLSAATSTDAGPMGGGGAAAGSGAASSSGTHTDGDQQPGSQPLPNPWAPAGGGGGGAAGAGAGAGGADDLLRSLQAAMGAGGGGGGGPGGLANMMAAGGAGGPGGSGGMAELTARMLDNPQMRESLISMMAQPGVLDMIATTSPQLNQLLNTMPGMRQAMQSPDMLRMMLNPDMLRAAAQMGGPMGGGAAAGAGGASGAGGFGDPAMLASLLGSLAGGGAAGGGGAPPAAGGPPGAGLEGLMQLMRTMGMGGAMGGAMGAGPFGNLAAPPPMSAADAATAYAQQLQQLQDMGFYDQESNIRALQATGGNVNAAVDQLLQQRF